MNLYYYAFQMYQFSYSKPLYEALGGTYVVKKFDRWLQFKRYFYGMNKEPQSHTFLNSPKVIIRPVTREFDGTGLIFSHSNIHIKCDPKKCIRVFIGHGTGDKPYGGNRVGAKNLLNYEYIFVSGPKHLARLQDSGVEISPERLIKIGNMRFDAVVNDTIDKEQVLRRLGVKDRSKKTVLYAPTWRFGNGTFHKYVKKFCKEISPHYNLIVRPHYHDAKHIPEIKIWAKLSGLKNIYFSDPSNLGHSDTMVDFVVSDILISDTSSVNYEYLITQKPLIIIENNYKKLHKMPDEMNILNCVDIYDEEIPIAEMIRENLTRNPYAKQQKDLLYNCFYFNDGKSTARAMDFVEGIGKRHPDQSR